MKTGLIVLISVLSYVRGDWFGDYSIGIGIGDVTGPSAGLGMMGYAALDQTANGIHTRLFARTFVVESEGQRIVFSSVDCGMIDQALKTAVVERLQEKYGNLYSYKNVLLSGTHTHSGPGGYIQYVMYSITSLGFNRQNFEIIVNGIVKSIERAHDDMKVGNVKINSGRLLKANRNRSKPAYEANPQSERDRYDSDVDEEMVLIRFDDKAGNPLGAFNWFPVHPTSLNNTNKLISGDNKGIASQLFERTMNPGIRPGKGKFVAAFASSNLGDVSPNTKEPICVAGPLAGQPCDILTSSCGGFPTYCISFGPGKDMFESAKIIGTLQYEKAYEIFNNASELLRGPVGFSHQFVNMSNYEIVTVNKETGAKEVTRTCASALGYSFAAGTTDGPGAFNFTQGSTNGNPFWDMVRDFLQKPSAQQENCHKPKPILLDIGESHWPFEWAPSVVETQIIRLGNLFIIGIPGELTTMSGRRMRESLTRFLLANGVNYPHVVIAGLSNVYTHYITTFEEYQIQRYEGASTIYGPNTLAAYLQQYTILADSMMKNTTLEDGPEPPNFLDRQISLVAPVFADTPRLLSNFGDVIAEPYQVALTGETVSATFVSGNPRNDPMTDGTFFVIEKQDYNDPKKWSVVATDGDLETKFIWKKTFMISANSEIEVQWEIPEDADLGYYRIRHFGYYKPALRSPRPYSGATRTFQVRKNLVDDIIPSPPEPVKRKTILNVADIWSALTGLRQKNTKDFMGALDQVGL